MAENWEHISLSFALEGQAVPLSRFVRSEHSQNGRWCRDYSALLTDWPKGSHKLTIEFTIASEIDDGWDVYTASTTMYQFQVTVIRKDSKTERPSSFKGIALSDLIFPLVRIILSGYLLALLVPPSHPITVRSSAFRIS